MTVGASCRCPRVKEKDVKGLFVSFWTSDTGPETTPNRPTSSTQLPEGSRRTLYTGDLAPRPP